MRSVQTSSVSFFELSNLIETLKHRVCERSKRTKNRSIWCNPETLYRSEACNTKLGVVGLLAINGVLSSVLSLDL